MSERRRRIAGAGALAALAAVLYGPSLGHPFVTDDAIYIVEANPNPYLADGEDLAWAAEEGGNLYPDFIEKIAEMAIIRGVSRG